MIQLIIDLNSVAMPHFFKQNKDPDESRGTFIANYMNLLESYEINPKNVLVCYDNETSRQGRQRIYPPYKTHRVNQLEPEEEQNLRTFLVKVREDIMSIGSAISVTHPRVEGDDLVVHFAQKNPNAILWAHDKDLFQCDNPIIYNNDLWTDDCPQEIPRKWITLYHAVVGDVKDYGPELCRNKIGPAFFKKLYKIFGETGLELLEKIIQKKQIKSLEEDLEEMPELKKLIDDERNVYIRYKLSRPLPIKDYLLKWESRIDKPTQRFITKADEWKVTGDKFLDAFDALSSEINEGHPVVYDLETYHTQQSLDWMENINKNVKRSKKDYIVVDPLGCVITGIGIKCGGFAGYFSFEHIDTDNCTKSSLLTLVDLISTAKRAYAHNSTGFELPVGYMNTGTWLVNTVDTQLMASYVDENSSKGLKSLSKRFLNYTQEMYQEVTQGRQMNELSLDEVFSYGIDDVYTTEALANLFRKIMEYEGSWNAFTTCEIESSVTTAMAYVNGVEFDQEKMGEIEAKDKFEAATAMSKIKKFLVNLEGYDIEIYTPLEGLTAKEIKRAYETITGQKAPWGRVRRLDKIITCLKKIDDTPKYLIKALENEDLDTLNELMIEYGEIGDLDVKSNKVMTHLLYEVLGYPVRFRGDLTPNMRSQGRTKGNPKADDVALQHAIKYDAKTEEEKQFLKNVIRVREYLTRKGLYYTPYPYFVHWFDGRIHSQLGQSKTTSRRFAPSNPNVNQLPKRGWGVRVRDTLTATPGYTLVSCDFSGQELRAGASFSGDATLLAAFVGDNKIDLHSAAGLKVDNLLDKHFKGSYDFFIEAKNAKDEKAKELRGLGKGMNFSLQYFGTSATLVKNLVVSESLANKMVQAYADTYPDFITWRETEAKNIMKNRYSTTKLGARRHLHKYFYNGDISQHWIRSGVNFIIQSSSAEQTKIAWGKSRKLIRGMDAAPLFPVHDQLVWEVRDEYLEEFIPKFLEIVMAPFWDRDIPSESDCQTGKRFGSLKDYE